MSQIIELDNDKPTHIKFITKQMTTKPLEPLLELYKGKLYTSLIKLFINDCVQLLGYHIFSIKKSYSRTITNLFSSWIFSLYIHYDFSEDYFLPSNYNNTQLLEETLSDLCKYNTSIIDINDKIKQIITNLKNNYKTKLDLLNNYKQSEQFKQNKNHYKIIKSITPIKRNKHTQHDTVFYTFHLSTSFLIKDKRLLNILNNILIPIPIYEKLTKVYTGPENKIDEYLWGIIFRYQLLGSNNHQLAVLPNIMKSMNNDYNLNFECFASTINSTFPLYCSIYYDLEHYFGSIGSFFNITPIKGTYGFNPPYQKDIIELGVNKLFTFLENTDEHLTFIITIPIWDNDGKAIMKEKYNNELEKQNIDYGDFDIINQMKTSKFYAGLRMIPKEQFTYIDHNFELYKNKTIQNTYVIILSNHLLILDSLNNYDFESFPLENPIKNE